VKTPSEIHPTSRRGGEKKGIMRGGGEGRRVCLRVGPIWSGKTRKEKESRTLSIGANPEKKRGIFRACHFT